MKAATDIGADAYGIDLDEQARFFGNKHGLRIETGDYRDLAAKFGARRFGAILMMHVLEHVAQPAEVLSALLERLDRGGILIVRVPDQLSVPSYIKRGLRAFGIKREEWGFVQPPIHLHGYTTRTFRVLAGMHDLELVQLRRTSPLDEQQFPTTARYWDRLWVQKQAYRLGRTLGSGGHLVAILRRRETSTASKSVQKETTCQLSTQSS